MDTSANPTISAIEPGRRRGRFNIYVSGVFAAAAGEKVIADLGLRVGQEFSPERLKHVADAEESRRALEAALRLLDVRPRATKEIGQRLRLKGYEEDVIAGVLATLKRMNFVDDAEFAKLWVESRGRANPKGVRMLRSELAQKGIAREVIDETLGDAAPEIELTAAKRALTDKIKNREIPTEKLERLAEYRRCAGFLQRRGFGWNTVKDALKDVFGRSDEVGEESATSD